MSNFFDNVRKKEPKYLYEGLIVFILTLIRLEKILLFILILVLVLGYFEYVHLTQISDRKDLLLDDLSIKYNFILDRNEQLELELAKRKEVDNASWYNYLFGNKKK